MKKIVSFCIIGGSIIFLASCGNNNNSSHSSSTSSSSVAISSSDSNKSITMSSSSTPTGTDTTSTETGSVTSSNNHSTNSTESGSLASSNSQPTNSLESDYYQAIKDAWNKQSKYISSIEDPQVKQSVQTPNSAATAEATKLQMEHPEDSERIESVLKHVLSGN